MRRNRLIFGLSRATIVVSADREKGEPGPVLRRLCAAAGGRYTSGFLQLLLAPVDY